MKLLLKANLSLLICLLAVLSTSCSLLSDRKALFEGESKEQVTKVDLSKNLDDQSVPKAQYQALQKKYETLLSERNSSDKGQYNLGEDGKKLLKKLDKATPNTDSVQLAETVDVFGSSNINNGLLKSAGQSINSSTSGQKNNKLIATQVNELNRALKLLDNKQYDQGMEILKQLEGAPSRQIQVRAKFYIGELLFLQGEYDLALQVFETIIKNYAFSGVVLKSLGRLVACSEKLNLKKKKEQYYSILYDFFEST